MEPKTKNNNHGIMFIDKEGFLWLTFSRPWWDLSEWLWYWLCSGTKALVALKRESSTDEEIVRMVSFGKISKETK